MRWDWLWAWLVGVGLLLSCAPSHARVPTRLVYARTQTARDCPDEAALASAVAARLGYGPFSPWGDQTILATISRNGGVLRGHAELIDHDGIAQGSREVRLSKPECDELILALALAISITLDPLHVEAPVPSPPEIPAPPADASESAVPLPEPATPSAAIARRDHAPIRARKGEPERVTWHVAAAGIGAFNLGPQFAMGGRLAVTAKRGRWALGVEAWIGCGANAVDLGHGRNGQGWSDTTAQEASTSTPQTIYDSDLPLIGFALDGPTLYALVYHAPTFDLISCPLERCRSQRTTLYSSPETGAELDKNFISNTTLAVAGGRVFWLSGSELMACPKTDCTEPQRLSSVDNTDCFAADGDTLYWLDRDHAVQRLKPNADVPEQVHGPLAEVLAADHLVVGGDYLYLSDPDAYPPNIHRVRKDGTGDLELVVEDNAIRGLSAVGNAIYYPSSVLSGRIIKCAPGDCAKGAVTLASNQRWPMEVRVADDEAFWLSKTRVAAHPSNSSLSSCRLPECTDVEIRVADFPIEPHANAPGDYPHFAVGPESLLWLEARFDEAGSSLRRLAR